VRFLRVFSSKIGRKVQERFEKFGRYVNVRRFLPLLPLFEKWCHSNMLLRFEELLELLKLPSTKKAVLFRTASHN